MGDNLQIVADRSPSLTGTPPKPFARLNVIDNGDGTCDVYIENRANSDAVSTSAAILPVGLKIVGSPSGSVSGSGTTDTLPKWTDGPGSVLGDSRVTDNGTDIVADSGAGDFLAGDVNLVGLGTQILIESNADDNIARISMGDLTGFNNSTIVTIDDNEQSLIIGSPFTPVTLRTPNGPTNLNGVLFNIKSGDGDGAGHGGDLQIFCGSGGDTGRGGDAVFISGAGGATSGNGGNFAFIGGDAVDGDGGSLAFSVGTGGGAGVDGSITLDSKRAGVDVGDVNGAGNSTLITLDDSAQTITLDATNGVIVNGNIIGGELDLSALLKVAVPAAPSQFFELAAQTTDAQNSAAYWALLLQAVRPNAPTAALAGAGAGNVDNGTHSYKITYVTASGESIGSPASNVLNVTDNSTNGQVALTGIGKGNGNVTARKIYRTVAGDTGAYMLVGTLNDNSTTTFTDNVADSSLGADIPTDNTTLDTTIRTNSAGTFLPNNYSLNLAGTDGNNGVLSITTANNLSLTNGSTGSLILNAGGAGAGNIIKLQTNNTDRLIVTQAGLLAFTGVAVTNVALKPNATELQVRLGNDSAYGAIAASAYSVGATAGVDGTFTTTDLKTVTVSKGLITAIV